MKVIQATLVLIENNNDVLMVNKKRGLGKNTFNLPGGVKNTNESFSKCAVREVFEETGINVSEINPLGIIYFVFKHKQTISEVHTFIGTPSNTNLKEENSECAPLWINKNKVPYDKMMPADAKFMPYILQKNKNCFIKVTFDEKWDSKMLILNEPLDTSSLKRISSYNDVI